MLRYGVPHHVDKPWGHEVWWARVPGHYVGKFLHVSAGHRLSLQYHAAKDETITLLSGAGYLDLGSTLAGMERIDLEPNVGVHVPPGWLHRLGAYDDMVCAEVSTDHLEDVVRVSDDYNRPGG